MGDFLYPFKWYLLPPLIFLTLLVKTLAHDLWWKPRKLENHFAKQGIRGPKYEVFLGNLRELSTLTMKAHAESMPPLSHDILPRVLPFYHHWKNLFGPMFVIWFGSTARLIISDPAHIKEIFFSKSEFFEKIEPPLLVQRIEGDGLLNLKGQKWAFHRKTIQPIFNPENLKLLIPIMAKTMEEALTKWTDTMANLGNVEMEVEVSIWFHELVEKVISKFAFGSCYEDGLAIFQLQTQQLSHAAEAYQKASIPGYSILRFLPTSQSRNSHKLEKEIRKSLLDLIDRRRRSRSTDSPVVSRDSPTDLLELMMKAADESSPSGGSDVITENDIVEECKTIFFAGTRTTANLMTWTAVLLAMHWQWQELAREEVFRVCGARDPPTKDDLTKLKTVGMIVNESLRLYPPVVATIRRAKTDVHLTGVHMPHKNELLIPILAVHHDRTLWGDDAHDFNPMRFAAGTAQAAKHPMAFIPFGLGSRRCIGQNLAVLQAKLAIAMILQRFSFELAPSYQHSPSIPMLLGPQYGAPIVFRKL